MPEPIYVVCNPQAGRGRGGRLLPALLEALRRHGLEPEHAQTRAAGEEATLAAEAVARGHRTVAVMGGDGTWSNAAAAMIATGQPVRMGLVPAGTGADLARSFGIPRDMEGCARVLATGQARPLDAGLIEGRPFLNVAGFGYDVAVIEDTRRVRGLRGPLLYLYCALRQIRSFEGFEVEVEVDGRTLPRRKALMVIVSNGRAFGGGFRLWPQADLADGTLESLVFHDMPALRRLGLLQRVRRGRHHGTPGVEDARGTSFTLRFARPPAYEVDGEWAQARTAELRIDTLPAALHVLAPAEA
ncbi:MAG TPA: diacylglycerol kinase family protein [Methylomirabilota bacterium]|nr:diacylglycerol kinase family protein [Methylomirabilota bacterium]